MANVVPAVVFLMIGFFLVGFHRELGKHQQKVHPAYAELFSQRFLEIGYLVFGIGCIAVGLAYLLGRL